MHMMHMYRVFIGVILFVYLERECNFACQTLREIATGRSQTPSMAESPIPIPPHLFGAYLKCPTKCFLP